MEHVSFYLEASHSQTLARCQSMDLWRRLGEQHAGKVTCMEGAAYGAIVLSKAEGLQINLRLRSIERLWCKVVAGLGLAGSHMHNVWMLIINPPSPPPELVLPFWFTEGGGRNSK